MDALKVGEKLPFFKAKDQNGNDFEITSVLGKKVLVIYFYPKDDTPGCTRQACFFRDNFDEFIALGAEVIGVSSDSVQSHKKFKDEYKLPYTLLADQDKALRKLFGVPNNLLGLWPGRVTYIVDKEGIVQMMFDSMKAENHFQSTLDEVKRLAR